MQRVAIFPRPVLVVSGFVNMLRVGMISDFSCVGSVSTSWPDHGFLEATCGPTTARCGWTVGTGGGWISWKKR